LVEIETDPLVPAPSSDSWWDVAVAEVSDLGTTVDARKAYEVSKGRQRRYL
jgi:3D-(3,5/4)-trihydroxycyclohexane-1,2-dione acylhydrolase (decyclizing)